VTVSAAEPTVVAAGLTAAEAAERRAAGLGNDYAPPSSRPVREILRANLLTRFNALLGSLFVVILVVGPLQDALFGLTLVANTLVGVVQELRAKRALDRLAVVTAPHATVIRDGTATTVDARDVVLDDIVQIAAGDQVVVDGAVLTAADVQLDESLLTGESRPVGKAPGDTVLSGSFVVAGSARFRVTAVGADSYAAKLESEARTFSLAGSEIRDGINAILRVITWVLVPTAALLFWSQLSRAGTVADALRGAVAGTVTMVPEGLILLSSVAFAVGALRLAGRRVLARELPSVEGLARVDTLCIDKTGTLTTGHLTVTDTQVLDETAPVAAATAALSRLEPHPNATAAALAAAFAEPSPPWHAQQVHPFSSATKWSSADYGPNGLWVLGAPDVLLPSDHPMRPAADAAAATGARVVLIARGRYPDDPARDVEPAALVSLRDEIRPDAATTLAYLADEGVSVRVLSGDHPDTVSAVARQVGLDTGEPVDARELPTGAAELAVAMTDRTVFGRVTPEQKRSMVQALQSSGHVVAMTGDGVNDVLALKSADVGIAMGSGSAATRAVAQLVLLDDAFTEVPTVIAEGRRVIANLERVANLFLTKTVYATLLALTVGLARLPFPFLPRHLTLISTLTIGVPAFVLALAPNAARARHHFVARVARFAVPTGIVAAGATYLAYVEARDDGATSLTENRTLCTIVLFTIALWVLAILVRAGDRRQSWLVPVMTLGMVTVLATPALRTFFALDLPRPLVLLAGVGAVALSGLALEAGWWLAARFSMGRHRGNSDPEGAQP
jgi:cation-transporting ATPase E